MNFVGQSVVNIILAFLCCLGALSKAAGAQPVTAGPEVSRPLVQARTGADFWIDGQPPGVAWPANFADPARNSQLVIWGSWCGYPETVGQIILGPFKAPDHFSMMVSGKPNSDGNSLQLVRATDSAQIVIMQDSPGMNWKQADVQLPADWVGKNIFIVSYDRTTTPDGWLAFSEPFTLATDGTIQPMWQNRTAGPRWHRWIGLTLGPFICIFLVMGLVGVAGYSILRRYVQTDVFLTPLLISASMGFLSYLTFWGYFAGRKFGQTTAMVIIILSAMRWVWGIATKTLMPREELKELRYPVLLLLIAGLFYLGLLWLPRSEGFEMESLAGRRATSWGLPTDNVLQEWLAQALHSGNNPKVVNSPDWSSSDRPPLQAGAQLLSARILVDVLPVPFHVNAQLTGVLLQLSWVYGLWALLRALGCTPYAAAQIIICLIPTPLLYINSIYVWAKLSAAAYALGITVILCLRGKRPLSLPEAAVAGVLFSLGLLCHSGIFFYLLPVLALWFVLPNQPGRPSWSCVVVLIAAATAVFLPWICYQKFFDPPGNHLLKLNFAGVIDSNSNSLLQTLRNAYGPLSRQTIIANKVVNFEVPFGGNWSTLFQLFPADRSELRGENFFNLFRSCGIFLTGALALPLLLLRRNRDKLRPVLFLMLVLTLGFFFWCSTMFGPGFTAMHQGAYGIPLVLLAMLAYLLRLVHPAVLQIVAVYNLLQFLWAYCWTFPYPPKLDGLSITAMVAAGALAIAILATGPRGFTNPILRFRHGKMIGASSPET
jgi:hypothetical protein